MVATNFSVRLSPYPQSTKFQPLTHIFFKLEKKLGTFSYTFSLTIGLSKKQISANYLPHFQLLHFLRQTRTIGKPIIRRKFQKL